MGSHVDGVDPGLDILELLRRDGVNAHPRLIVLADEHHVEVLEVVRDTLKVCDLELVGVEHEEGGLGEVDEAVLRRHEERLAAAAQNPTVHSFQTDEGHNLMAQKAGKQAKRFRHLELEAVAVRTWRP